MKDIKEVAANNRAAQEERKQRDFKWDTMGGNKGPQQPVAKEEHKKNDATNIQFSKGKFAIKKSTHVGNKGDFPELGDDFKPNKNAMANFVAEAKPQVTASVQNAEPEKVYVKPTFTKQVKRDKPVEEPVQVPVQPQVQATAVAQPTEEVKVEEEKKRPVFKNGGALKDRLRKQQEDNAELNANLPEQI